MAFAPLNEDSFSEDQVAVAVRDGGFSGGHVGIGFFGKDGQPKVLHLAWHHRRRIDFIPEDIDGDCWIAQVLPVPPSAGKQIVAYLRVTSAENMLIPYGLDILAARGSFGVDGKYRPSSDSDGLTCATFVTEVFRGAEVQLLEEDTWPLTAANVEWGKVVHKELAHNQADPLHIAAVANNIEKGLRIRPFEVAGASDMGPNFWPVSFQDSQQPADAVEAALSGCCGAGNVKPAQEPSGEI